MDDVTYVVPEHWKSFGLISYLYAKTNSVPQNQFEIITDNSKIQENDKIHVVLDDLCASGHSMLGVMSDMHYSDNYIFAPVIACKTGIETINKKIKEKGLKNTKLIYSIKYKDLGFIHECQIQEAENFTIEEYIKQFKNFNMNDVDFIFKYLKGGYGKMYTFICTPYMIPDNSSELNAFFGGYFSNNDNEHANKIVKTPDSYDMSGISYDRYIKIKNNIENTINESPS